MEKTKPRILLIQTGGTIDAVPYADAHNPPPFVDTLKGENSLVESVLKEIPGNERVDRFTYTGSLEDRMNKDSQRFTERDIKLLAQTIKEDSHTHFIITHGTSAMVRNAKALTKELEGSGKVVAFVGAMVPLSMQAQHPSDGVDSLKFAIDTLGNQEPGVYITGRGANTNETKFFYPDKVIKDWDKSLEDLTFTLKGIRRNFPA